MADVSGLKIGTGGVDQLLAADSKGDILLYGYAVGISTLSSLGNDLFDAVDAANQRTQRLSRNNESMDFLNSWAATNLGKSTPLGQNGADELSLRMQVDGVTLDASRFNAVKYVYNNGLAGYASLPLTEVKNTDFSGIATGTLVHSNDGNYYRVTSPGIGTRVSSPLGPAVEVSGTDFSKVEPGRMAHSDNGKYYLVTSDHQGVEVDGQVQKFIDSPTQADIDGWKTQYLSLNSELGKSSLADQINLQDLSGAYNQRLSLLSNLLAARNRMGEKVSSNL